jgi:hypothetical protein
MFYEMGFLCPSCGGTRAVRSFFELKFFDAFAYNAFVAFLLVYLFAIAVILNLAFVLNIQSFQKVLRLAVNYKVVIAFAGLYAVFGVLRNFI